MEEKNSGLMKSLFPPVDYLEGKYEYLQDKPWLLPIAWGQRIHKYMKERKGKQVNPAKSIEIGRQRIELLKKYGIIE